ncbi:MAG TPA: GNAT family N-acetyltransferase [Xanthomonadaceae bacterium]|nr:GNAT family N-acetyltransferase [Xanthomonadaceae bacterium]
MTGDTALPTIRPITAADDVAVAAIIRTVMPEFGACGPGFAIHDAEVDAMCAAYRGPRSAYFVVERDGRVLGGGGVAPLQGGAEDVCELRKMYFLPEARGLGVGAALLDRCLRNARDFGFRACYLETLEHMHAAQRLYERFGFRRIDGPMGSTGHFSCNTFFLLEL